MFVYRLLALKLQDGELLPRRLHFPYKNFLKKTFFELHFALYNF